jgi:hypothetical protein
MIGHDNVRIKNEAWKFCGQFIPHVVDHFALLIEFQFSTIWGGSYISEQAYMILDANGDEICSRL